MANGNNSYSGVQGSGPGTSSSFGVALLDRQVKRSDELMKRKEDREDKLKKAMIIGEVGGWLLDGVVNDFHNSNTTTYGNMQTVLDNSKSVIQQNQAIVDSGKSYDEYFYDQEYNILFRKIFEFFRKFIIINFIFFCYFFFTQDFRQNI